MNVVVTPPSQPSAPHVLSISGELDVVSCGPGVDVARLDASDVIEGATPAAPDGDCERVRRGVPRPGSDAPEERPDTP